MKKRTYTHLIFIFFFLNIFACIGEEDEKLKELIIEDLIIQVIEQSDEIYKRKGDDLYIEHTLSLVESLCGCVISINHMDDILDFKIDNIIKPNTLYKLEGKGMPIKYNENELSENDKSKKYGDLIIDFTILFPQKLDDKRKDILKKVFNYVGGTRMYSTIINLINYF